jgi:hypothetical protein
VCVCVCGCLCDIRIAPKAKYGDESVYFDLKDVENTAGSWDMYGVDSTKRYPDRQVSERVANPLPDSLSFGDSTSFGWRRLPSHLLDDDG